MSRELGFWVGDFPAAEKFHIRAAMDVIRVEDRLRAGQVKDADLYDAFLVVTGNEAEAAEAYSNAIAAKLRAGQTPQI